MSWLMFEEPFLTTEKPMQNATVGRIVGESPRAITLNERLNKALDRIESDTQRIGCALARMNGVPSDGGSKETCAALPVRSLVGVVEGLEKQAEVLRNLAEGVDQIG
jgi:hypothetical protein